MSSTICANCVSVCDVFSTNVTEVSRTSRECHASTLGVRLAAATPGAAHPATRALSRPLGLRRSGTQRSSSNDLTSYVGSVAILDARLGQGSAMTLNGGFHLT